MDSRTRRTKEVFLRCTDLDATEWEEVLARECADDEHVRAGVRALLRSSRAAPPDFLEAPQEVVDAADLARTVAQGDRAPPAATSAVSEQPGDRIGRYRLVQRIGEGGFGVVWEAEQREPIRRRVALKLIKLGMDTRQVIARFEAERQALAMMAHPHIATVLDAGATESGRPYFVMELVTGTPVLDFCESEKLPLAARLELFANVCRAIHHAHQKGIIHRDIKPTNVLVMRRDEDAIPKIIDFGIAKATNPEVAQGTLLTQQRQLVGTPAYMAPEQTTLGGRDIDTRSDIYSLGVLLYEMLTGETPFDSESLASGSWDEIIRVIREEEPLRPSERLASAAGTKGGIGSWPGADGTSCREDLDWIVMKCLEKDRSRRYETAEHLAEDVRRHLRDEPVEAGPPSVAYRYRKYYRRHRVPILLGAGLLAFLFTFLTVGFAWTAWKNRELDASNFLLDAKNAELEREKTAALNALSDVERLSDARVLDALEARATTALWPAVPEKADLMRAWLQEATTLMRRADQHRETLRAVRAKVRKRSGGAEPEAGPFASTKEAWLHGLLHDLVRRLGSFDDPKTGTIRSVRQRLAFASDLENRSIHQHRARWRETIQAVRTSEVYGGLQLEPQMGLVPLGPDPESGLYEFLHLASHRGPLPARDSEGRLRQRKTTGIVLVLIPGGTFDMGAQSDDSNAPNYDADAMAREQPVHSVTLASFFLSKYEMTQAQWMGIENKTNPSHYKTTANIDRLRHPVEQVDWPSCTRVLRQVDLELPTEAQWKYGARAGTTTRWSTGSRLEDLATAANIADKSAKIFYYPGWRHHQEISDGFVVHAPVGSLLPNEFGLHDVHGNVWEWCRDRLSGNYAAQYLVEPDTGLRHSEGIRYPIRGGAYPELAYRARSSHRGGGSPVERRSSIGLRPSRRCR